MEGHEGSLWTSRRALTNPFPNKFSGTNFLFLITCTAAFLSPDLKWSHCTNTAQGEGGFDLVFSFQVKLSQALWNMKDKWRGNEATYLLFFLFSRRKKHWNIRVEELSSQGASSTGLVSGTISEWGFFPESPLRNGENKHQGKLLSSQWCFHECLRN